MLIKMMIRLLLLNGSFQAMMWSILKSMVAWSYTCLLFMKIVLRSMLRIMYTGLI